MITAFEVTLPKSIEDVESSLRPLLGAEGFGVLTEIDVSNTIEAKLGVKRPKLRILGACNPALVNEALDLDESVALVVPCNVVLQEIDQGVRVSIVDPRTLLASPQLSKLANEAAKRLERVLEQL